MNKLMLIFLVLLMFEGTAHSFVLDSFELEAQAGILNPPDLRNAEGECGGISVIHRNAISSSVGLVRPDGPRNEFVLVRSTWLTSVAQTESTTMFTVDEGTRADFLAELMTEDSSGMQSDLYCRAWEVDGADLFEFDEQIEATVNPHSVMSYTLYLQPGSYGFFCSALIANQNSFPDDFADSQATAAGFFDVDLIPVPEPTLLSGLGVGVLFLVGVRRARGN